MLPHVSSRERLGIFIIGAIVLLGLGYLGSSSLKRTEPVTIVQESDTLTPTVPKPSTPIDQTQAVTPTEVVAHVVGAVKQPRVAHLKQGARIQDAIDAAGGPTTDADLEAINLAAKVEDGSQVFVPRKGKPEEPSKVATQYQGGPAAPNRYAVDLASTATSSSRSGPKKDPAGPVSLNGASEAQLESLPGVGPATAQKILDYRKEHGRFTAVEEIMAVKGIGQKKFDKMRQWLKL